MDIITDLVQSAYSQGFRRFLVLNGHGGNIAAKSHLQELVHTLPALRVIWYAWWQAPSVQKIAQTYNLPQAHANWQEAFPFTRLVEIPEEEKPTPKTDELLNPTDFRTIYGDGSFGGPYLASEEVMQALFDAALKDILHLLSFEIPG